MSAFGLPPSPPPGADVLYVWPLMAPIFIVSADRASEVWRIFRRPNIRQIGMYGGFTTGRSPHSLARDSRSALVAAAPLMDHIGNIGGCSLRRPPSLAGIEGH